MKYIALVCIAFSTSLSTHSMHHQLDFTKHARELGTEKGKREANSCLKTASTGKDVLRPLVKELNSAAQHLAVHPEAKSSFEGFVVGFGIVLFTNNEKRKHCTQPVFTFESSLLHELTADSQERDARTIKNREELIKLLTAKLTEMKLLV